MQTFLPLKNFVTSAQVLDRARLGKQRVEVLQILHALDTSREPSRWANHPAVRMWRGYPGQLIEYGAAICIEWARRGYRDSCYGKITAMRWTGTFEYSGKLESFRGIPTADHPLPPWFGDDAFHQAHRSNLLRKNPEHYRPHWPRERDDLPYVWPVA